LHVCQSQRACLSVDVRGAVLLCSNPVGVVDRQQGAVRLVQHEGLATVRCLGQRHDLKADTQRRFCLTFGRAWRGVVRSPWVSTLSLHAPIARSRLLSPNRKEHAIDHPLTCRVLLPIAAHRTQVSNEDGWCTSSCKFCTQSQLHVSSSSSSSSNSKLLLFSPQSHTRNMSYVDTSSRSCMVFCDRR
jgi:hypothetical protein